MANAKVKKGDVLFNRTNSRDLVGKTCAFNLDEPMIIAGYIIRLRMNGRVLPEYLSTFLNLDSSKKMLFEMAKALSGRQISTHRKFSRYSSSSHQWRHN